MEHIEEAGVHSGDSSCQIPPATLVRRRARRDRGHHPRASPGASACVGLLNLQLAVKDERIWVLEANPRASRTVPFVSKVIGVSLARIATLVLTGRTLAELRAEGVLPADPHHYRHLPYTGVKAAVLPFGRFPGVDTVLGPEMKSTGEVMGIDADPGMGAREGAGRGGARRCRASGTVFVCVANRDKRAIVFPAKRLADLGFRLLATGGTAGVLRARRHPGRARREGVRGTRQRGGADPGWDGRPRDQHAVRTWSANATATSSARRRRRRACRASRRCPASSRRCAASRRSAAGPASRVAPGVPRRGDAASRSQVRLSFAEAGRVPCRARPA